MILRIARDFAPPGLTREVVLIGLTIAETFTADDFDDFEHCLRW